LAATASTFAFLSAIIYSLRGIIEKRIIHNVNKYIVGLAIRLFALPFLLLPFLFKPSLAAPIHHLNASFWIAIFTICFINTPIETVLYYEALKLEELSLVLPILSLGPVITILLGTVTLREIPTFWGALGVLLIVLGLYTLKLQHVEEGLLAPFKHLRQNRGIQLMFFVMLSQGIAAIFDKMGTTNSNAYVYAICNYIGVSITLFVLAFIKARKYLNQLITQSKSFIVLGGVIAGYTLLYFISLESGFAAYASAIKSSFVIFTILFGLFFLREKEGKQKIIAGCIIFVGLALLKAFG